MLFRTHLLAALGTLLSSVSVEGRLSIYDISPFHTVSDVYAGSYSDTRRTLLARALLARSALDKLDRAQEFGHQVLYPRGKSKKTTNTQQASKSNNNKSQKNTSKTTAQAGGNKNNDKSKQDSPKPAGGRTGSRERSADGRHTQATSKKNDASSQKDRSSSQNSQSSKTRDKSQDRASSSSQNDQTRGRSQNRSDNKTGTKRPASDSTDSNKSFDKKPQQQDHSPGRTPPPTAKSGGPKGGQPIDEKHKLNEKGLKDPNKTQGGVIGLDSKKPDRLVASLDNDPKMSNTDAVQTEAAEKRGAKLSTSNRKPVPTEVKKEQKKELNSLGSATKKQEQVNQERKKDGKPTIDEGEKKNKGEAPARMFGATKDRTFASVKKGGSDRSGTTEGQALNALQQGNYKGKPVNEIKVTSHNVKDTKVNKEIGERTKDNLSKGDRSLITPGEKTGPLQRTFSDQERAKEQEQKDKDKKDDGWTLVERKKRKTNSNSRRRRSLDVDDFLSELLVDLYL